MTISNRTHMTPIDRLKDYIRMDIKEEKYVGFA
jgi:hypothetical protein